MSDERTMQTDTRRMSDAEKLLQLAGDLDGYCTLHNHAYVARAIAARLQQPATNENPLQVTLDAAITRETDLGLRLNQLRSQLAARDAEIAKLQQFKDYVHKRLDEAGVPHDPDPEHNKTHGCRIGGRLNWLITARLWSCQRQLAACEADIANMKTALEAFPGRAIEFQETPPESAPPPAQTPEPVAWRRALSQPIPHWVYFDKKREDWKDDVQQPLYAAPPAQAPDVAAMRAQVENLLRVMEMQEKRESEQFHIPQETMFCIWNDAKVAARAVLASLASGPSPDVYVLRKALVQHASKLRNLAKLSERHEVVGVLHELAHDVDNLLAALSASPQTCPTWISVKERLPEINRIVIVQNGIARWTGEKWITETGSAYGREIIWNVTHWQQFPAPPVSAASGGAKEGR